jgi:hypothetical protein
MSTFSSKPTKTLRPVDFVSVFVLLALVLILLVIPFTGNLYSALSTTFGSVGRTDTSISAYATYSFSADQEYWAENCSHGWSSDSTCSEIVTRSQSCSISSESAYCSEYSNYLRQFSN